MYVYAWLPHRKNPRGTVARIQLEDSALVAALAEALRVNTSLLQLSVHVVGLNDRSLATHRKAFLRPLEDALPCSRVERMQLTGYTQRGSASWDGDGDGVTRRVHSLLMTEACRR